MHLIRKDGRVYLLRGTKRVKAEISDVASYRFPGYNFADAYLTGFWDGRTRMVRKMRGINCIIIPWGFFKEASRIVRRAGGKVTDKARIPSYKFDWVLESLKLRPYQKKAIKTFTKKNFGGVLHVPTAGGKTMLAAGFITRFCVPTLYIVRGLDLVQQTYDFLKTTIGGEHPDIRMIRSRSSLPKPPYPNIVVCSINTLYAPFAGRSRKSKRRVKDSVRYKRRKEMREFIGHYKLVIGDECHEVGCDQFLKPLAFLTAPLRVFCSGTPYYNKEHRDVPLKAIAGNLFYSISTGKLIKLGYLCRSRIYFLVVGKGGFSCNSDEDYYQDVYDRGIVKFKTRNDKISLIVSKLIKRGRRVIVLVKRLPHGRMLQRRLTKKGINAVFLHGDCSVGFRKYHAKKLGRGKSGKCVIATSIFDKGINIPKMDAIVIAAGGKEPLRALQRLGRGLRAVKGKSDVIVFDFMDYQDRDYLLRHSRSRARTYRKNNFNVKVVSTIREAIG